MDFLSCDGWVMSASSSFCFCLCCLLWISLSSCNAWWDIGGQVRGNIGGNGAVCSLSHLDTLDTFTAAPCKCCLDNRSQSPESYFWLYVTILLKRWGCQKFLLTISNYLMLSAISKLFKYLKKKMLKIAYALCVLDCMIYVNVYNVHKWQMTY